MTKATSLAGLALAAMVMILAGCGEVKKCKRGEEGCIGEVPKPDDTCSAGLELQDGICVEPSGGGGGPGGGGNCNCAIDEICAEDGETCLAYCESLDELPQTRATPPRCAAISDQPALTFQQICVAACQQTCLREQAFCSNSACKLANCETPALMAVCDAACPGKNVACMEDACFDLAAETCTEYTCPTGSTRSCTDVKCNDSCDSENIADGFCDDGDPQSATYAFCSFGTDCTDCGPRKGTRPPLLPLGAPCPGGQDVSCQGYNDDYLKTQAWCLRFGESSDPFRCVPDCTTADGEGECPDDYECQAVLNSAGQPFRDATSNRTPGYACVPIVCE